jgi:hypothetical protein
MKRLLFLATCFFSMSNFTLNAQESIRKIEYRQTFAGPKFYNYYQTLKPRDLVETTSEVPEAHRYMLKAKADNTLAGLLGAMGGLLIGFPAGTSVAGGDPNWNIAIIGGVLVVASIPFSVSFQKNAIKGADLYNASLQPPDADKMKGGIKIQMRLSASVNGAGLTFNF